MTDPPHEHRVSGSKLDAASRHVRYKTAADAGNGLQRRRQLEDGGFEWTTCEDIVDLYSMAPWGRIALDVEQVRVAQAMDMLNGLNYKVLGAHVDGVFFESNGIDAKLNKAIW